MATLLTDRQKQILQLIVDGKTKSQIAALLGISPKTVGKHHGNLLRKYDVETRAELIAQAVVRGDVKVESTEKPTDEKRVLVMVA